MFLRHMTSFCMYCPTVPCDHVLDDNINKKLMNGAIRASSPNTFVLAPFKMVLKISFQGPTFFPLILINNRTILLRN